MYGWKRFPCPLRKSMCLSGPDSGYPAVRWLRASMSPACVLRVVYTRFQQDAHIALGALVLEEEGERNKD